MRFLMSLSSILLVFVATVPSPPVLAQVSEAAVEWRMQAQQGTREAWQKSIHYREKVRCSACHSDHSGSKAAMTADAPVDWTDADAATVTSSSITEYSRRCAGCHKAAVDNHKTTFHWQHAALGKKNIPTCAYCHVGHEPPLTSEQNPLHPTMMGLVCAGCHGGSEAESKRQMADNLSGPNTGATLYGRDIYGLGWLRISHVIDGAYILLIVLSVGFAIFFVIIDLVLLRRQGKHQIPRSSLSLGQHVQHVILAISFTTLALTGFTLKYPETYFAHLIVNLVGGADGRSIVHRLAAIIFVGNAYIHFFYYIFVYRGSWLILPRLEDLNHAKQDILYRLGRVDAPSQPQQIGWLQKLEYWAGVIGLHIVLVTGGVMWFFDWFLQHSSYQIIRYAKSIHGWEAILAVSVVAILHGYLTIVRPAVVAMNGRRLSSA